jgi:sigma-E factor negative regulatory protein RseC
MEETGTVLKVVGNEATVRFERTEACKKCGACKLGQDGEMLLHVSNDIGAKAGDHISVSLKESDLFTASLLAYGLPLAGLLGGLFLGQRIASLFPTVNPDAVMIGCSAILTVGAFLINRALEPSRRRKNKYQPIPTAIHDPTQEENEHGK